MIEKSGFTVLELLIVVVIIGILILIAVPYLKSARKTAQVGATIDTLRNICSAEEAYFAKMDNKKYGNLKQLANRKFLDNRFLEDNVIINDYSFMSSANNLTFKVTAKPLKPDYPEFYIDESFVLKFSNGTPIGIK